MVASPRQPGSALKPFLHGLAFDCGYTASVLADVLRTYATATGPYQPSDYDRRYHGPVRAREAGAREDAPVRWWVDGAPTRSARWKLWPGRHGIRAVAASGRVAEVTVEVM